MILRLPDTPPAHHPSMETLSAYAAGNLRAGFDVVTAVHMRGCAQCRGELAALEALGGVVLDQTAPVSLGDDALVRAMARLETPEHKPAPPRTLEDLIDKAKRRWVAPGIWVAKIETPHAPGDRVYMLSAAPGAATAMHSHDGLEFTQILSGSLNDEGVVYRIGDFTERGATHTHQPLAVGEEPCVCLFATHGRLTPKGLIGRIAFALADV